MRGARQRSRKITGLVLAIFFVISFLTNILGPIIPDVIRSFGLSLTAAALLPFSFFLAYGAMSIPAGLWVERFSEKPVILAAFVLSFAAALGFAALPAYSTAIVSLFAIGAGMAVLQVAINPLLRVAGGEERFAFNSALAQLVFGLASFLSPRVYSWLVLSLGREEEEGALVSLAAGLVPRGLEWVSVYWLFTLVTLAMVLILLAFRFPRVERKEEERAGSWSAYGSLLRKPVTPLYFASIFAYVGSEQGTANWMSQFLATYHRLDPQTAGASAVSWFWGLMTAGCLAGLGLLKLFDSRHVLIGASAGALGALTAALFGPAAVSAIAFPLIGLFASVMWPVLISLGLNSVAEHHGAFAGILCTAIVGGAVVPLVIGRIGDQLGLRAGMLFLYLTLGWVLSAGFWAKPLISNETVRRRRGGRGEEGTWDATA